MEGNYLLFNMNYEKKIIIHFESHSHFARFYHLDLDFINPYSLLNITCEGASAVCDRMCTRKDLFILKYCTRTVIIIASLMTRFIRQRPRRTDSVGVTLFLVR